MVRRRELNALDLVSISANRIRDLQPGPERVGTPDAGGEIQRGLLADDDAVAMAFAEPRDDGAAHGRHRDSGFGDHGRLGSNLSQHALKDLKNA
jgi:hypothetical protein